MRTILVDDEPLAMEEFQIECEQIPYLEVAGLFTDAQAALDFARHNQVDFALLDIDMPGMNGLELAEHLRSLYPEMIVIFVTAHSEHAANAMKMKADAFILKPYEQADIEDAIERARLLSHRQKKRVYFRTFGTFDLFVDEQVVPFSNQKAKELLALCVDKAGGTVSMQEAIDKLWESDPLDSLSKQKYRTAVMNIGHILEENGADDILVRLRGTLAIRKELVDADAYQLLEGTDPEVLSAYQGEYMSEYSWAEPMNYRLMEVKEAKLKKL